MKANETPEKIYLNKHPFTGELHDKWLRNKWDDSDIEYVRKDAFIEKACTFLETYPHMFMGVLRSEMIEDFKKYMKER